MIRFSGVRSSCDIDATKSDLSWLAASSSSHELRVGERHRCQLGDAAGDALLGARVTGAARRANSRPGGR